MMRGNIILPVVFISALLVALALLPPFYVTLFSYIGLSAIVALGLTLLTGNAGLISFGQAAFVGLSAYITGYLTTAAELSPWLTLWIAVALTGVAASLIGAITLRLSGHYLPLGTIAWGISIYYLFGNLQFIGGHTGLTGIPPLSIGGYALIDPRWYASIIWFVTVLAAFSVNNILNSRTGRGIRMLHGRSDVDRTFGVDIARLKIAVFVYAALLAAISGWLYAHMLRFINPTPFGLNAGIEYLFMVVVGGAVSIGGAILGPALLTLIKQWLQDALPGMFGHAVNVEIIVYGILMAALLQKTRSGLWPYLQRFIKIGGTVTLPQTGSPLPRRFVVEHVVPLLSMRNVTKQFGGLVSVNDVTFDVSRGEILGVIGPNGAGKSTLFNLISGLLPLTSGEISFCGSRIDLLPPHQRARRGLARTFQHALLHPKMTAIENVAIGAYSRTQAGLIRSALRLDRAEERDILFEARAKLEEVGLGAFALSSAGAMPLGQQRILEIARAAAADPVLLLLDEPAAGLRRGEKDELAALLRRLSCQGITIILVEHDMQFVMNLVDRLVVMDFGIVIANGPPAEIRQNAAVIAAYLGTEAA
jgi:branched-chain amino acid transport system permease protein